MNDFSLSPNNPVNSSEGQLVSDIFRVDWHAHNSQTVSCL